MRKQGDSKLSGPPRGLKANTDAQLQDPPAERIKAPLHIQVREWTQAWKQAECIYSGDAGGSSCITE